MRFSICRALPNVARVSSPASYGGVPAAFSLPAATKLKHFLLCLCLASSLTNGFAQENLKLVAPRKDAGKSIMAALHDRRTTREVSDKKLSEQIFSEVLWAAGGTNRLNGERTAPSALGKHPVDIYVVTPEAIYLYHPNGHSLAPVATGDFRKDAGTQPFAQTAPLNLVFVLDLDKLKDQNAPESDKISWANIEAGAQSQNVYLYCASEGLGATVRVSIDKQQFGKAAKLRPQQVILLAQTIGYPK